MSRRFSPPACLVLLCGLIAPGPTTAEAAGIGVHLRGHAQNIPRAVAGGHNPHVGVGAGADFDSAEVSGARAAVPPQAARMKQVSWQWRLMIDRPDAAPSARSHRSG